MPARSVGSVRFDVEMRGGPGLIAEAYATGKAIGTALEKGANEKFDLGMSRLSAAMKARMTQAGKFAGITFGNSMQQALLGRRAELSDTLASIFLDKRGFENFVGQSERVSEGLDKIMKSAREARDEGVLTERQFNSIATQTEKWGSELLKVEERNDRVKESMRELNLELARGVDNHDRVSAAYARYSDTQKQLSVDIDKATTSQEKNNKEVEKGGHLWKRLSANTRQWTLIIGAVLAGGEQIATLGSAAGAGLAIAGGALAALVPALVVAGAGMVSLIAKFSRLDELTNIPPYITALQQLGSAFAELGEEIEVNLFTPLTENFDKFRTVVLPGISTAVQSLASSMGNSLSNLLDRLASPRAISQFNAVLEVTDGLFDSLVETVGHLISGIAGFVIAAGPSIERFGGWLSKITSEFDHWINSLEGQNAVREWLEAGERVLSKFAGLVGALSTMLGNLVTEESVKRTENFLQSLTDATPFFEKIFTVLGELDVFGLLAQVLDEVGNALGPVLDFLEPIASIINTALSSNITMLAAALNVVSLVLTPFTVGLNLLDHFLTRVAEHFAPVNQAMLDASGVGGDLATRITEGVLPAFDEMITTILDSLPPPEEMVRILREDVIPALSKAADFIVITVIPALTLFFDKINEIVDSLGGWDAVMVGLDKFLSEIQFWARQLSNALKGPVGWLENLIALFKKLSGADLGKIVVPVGGVADRFASGGLATSRSITGEAGPEWQIPATLPLNQVDASVRDAAAFMRGRYMPSTGAAGKSVSVTFEDGAIRSNASDSSLVALDVVDEIAEKVA